MGVVRINAKACNAVVDKDVMAALRRSVGGGAFDEMFEDALCDVTERLSAIDRAVATGDLVSAGAEAAALSVVSSRLGLQSVSAVAAALAQCCGDDDAMAATAVAARLSRLGERCVLAAAELSVELGVTARWAAPAPSGRAAHDTPPEDI